MNGGREFLLGVLLGASGNMLMDIPSAVLAIKNNDDTKRLVVVSYAVFFLILLLVLAEVFDND